MESQMLNWTLNDINIWLNLYKYLCQRSTETKYHKTTKSFLLQAFMNFINNITYLNVCEFVILLNEAVINLVLSLSFIVILLFST